MKSQWNLFWCSKTIQEILNNVYLNIEWCAYICILSGSPADCELCKFNSFWFFLMNNQKLYFVSYCCYYLNTAAITIQNSCITRWTFPVKQNKRNRDEIQNNNYFMEIKNHQNQSKTALKASRLSSESPHDCVVHIKMIYFQCLHKKGSFTLQSNWSWLSFSLSATFKKKLQWPQNCIIISRKMHVSCINDPGIFMIHYL